MKQRRSLLWLLALLAFMGAIWLYLFLLTPAPQTLDQRVYEVAEQLKCPVCQNESVASSSASVATEMRSAIRQQLQSGKSEQQVLAYFAAHYGNQILLTPPQEGFNLLAWLMPLIMLLFGLGVVSFVAYNWRKQSRRQREKQPEGEPSLDDAEFAAYQAELEREMADDDLLFGAPGMERM